MVKTTAPNIDYSSSTYSTLEMTKRYKEGPKKEVMKVAMAAVIFQNLQSAGYINKEARLSHELPPSSRGFEGRTYKQRLVQLITDRDSDQKLDINLKRLKNSGILSKEASLRSLDELLSNRAPRALSDRFVKRQQWGRDMMIGTPQWHVKARRIKSYSMRIAFTNGVVRNNERLVREAGSSRLSSQHAHSVAKSAIAQSQLQNARGDQNRAQKLLAEVGGQLQAGGHFEQATRIYQELKTKPYANSRINLVQKWSDKYSAQNPGYNRGRSPIELNASGSKVKINEPYFDSTNAGLADIRLAQMKQTRRMEAVLNRKVNPANIDDARQYFQAFSKEKSTQEVRKEYQTYLTNFYTHSGEGITWDKSTSDEDRPGKIKSLLARLPADDAGRKIVDCQGFGYITENIMESIHNKAGNQRFEVLHAGRPGHVIAGVFETEKSQGFLVDNNETKFLSRTSNDRTRYQRMARHLSEGTYDLIGYGHSPADSIVQVNNSPVLGAKLWVNNRVVGVVNEAVIDDFRAGGHLNASKYIKMNYVRD